MRPKLFSALLKKTPHLCFSVLALACLFSPIQALEPPTPAQIESYRLDGSLETRIENAKSLGNHRVSPYLVRDADRRLKGLAGLPGSSQTPPPAWRNMPTAGNVKVFALLIAFSDIPFNTPGDVVNSRLFGDGTAGIPYDSLRNFYRRSSYEQLEIQGATLGWYTTSYPRSDVQQNTRGREDLIKEALNYYEAQGHDFSQYDNDGDGTIDYFLVVWTGKDNGWANFWWGYQTYIQDRNYKLDGKKLGAYSWQWEARPFPGEFSPDVTIHETGHALGLPDYYDYDGSVGPDGGVGGLDQMDWYGDHNCFSKFLLDWITPAFCNSPPSHEVSLHPSETSKDALVVMPGAQEGNAFGEYFMVQVRNQTGNDAEFPNQGLLIWHVDAQLNNSGTDYLFDNSYTPHKLLRLMEADGLEEIERNKAADAGDFYTEGTAFGPDTTPNSRRYSGRQSGVGAGSISPYADPMNFNLSCAFDGPYLEYKSNEFADFCPAGGPGGGNGAADPGEVVHLYPQIENAGGAAATRVEATISCAADGVTITKSSACYPALQPSESSAPQDPFIVTLGKAFQCGAKLDFKVHATSAENQAGWDMPFTMMVGSDTIFYQPFESWPLPEGWKITGVGKVWGSGLAYGCRLNSTTGTGDFAAADADCNLKDTGLETAMETPPVDLSRGYESAQLQFKTDIQDYYGTTHGYIDASTDGGQNWTNIAHYWPNRGIPYSGTRTVELRSYLGKSEVRFRFRYLAEAWDMWWLIDDLKVVTNCISKPCGTYTCSVICSAAAPASAKGGVPAQFSCDATYEGCTTLPNFFWSFGDGTTSREQNPEHTYGEGGSFTWTVSIERNGAVCSKSGQIEVAPPCTVTCSASAPSEAVAGQSITFAGEASSADCSGNPTSKWDLGDGTTSNELSLGHTYAAPGTYSWVFTAEADGRVCSRGGSVTVAPPPCLLTCEATAAPDHGEKPLIVAFSARSTAEGCQTEVKYRWDFGDGTTSEVQDTSHTYGTPGNYTWTLTATSGEFTCSKGGSVEVTAPVCTLACSAAASPQSGLEPLSVDFSSSVVAKGCGETPSISWEFGDGSTSHEPNLRRVYAKEGSYTWKMTAAAEGKTCQASGVVTVGHRVPGDADGDGAVSIGELQQVLNMYLGIAPPGNGADCNGDGMISIDELQKVINAFLGLTTDC